MVMDNSGPKSLKDTSCRSTTLNTFVGDINEKTVSCNSGDKVLDEEMCRWESIQYNQDDFQKLLKEFDTDLNQNGQNTSLVNTNLNQNGQNTSLVNTDLNQINGENTSVVIIDLKEIYEENMDLINNAIDLLENNSVNNDLIHVDDFTDLNEIYEEKKPSNGYEVDMLLYQPHISQQMYGETSLIPSKTPKPDIVCNLCNTTFTQKKSLYRHIRTLHGKKSDNKNVCSECNKKFKRKDILIRHTKRHCINKV